MTGLSDSRFARRCIEPAGFDCRPVPWRPISPGDAEASAARSCAGVAGGARPGPYGNPQNAAESR